MNQKRPIRARLFGGGEILTEILTVVWVVSSIVGRYKLAGVDGRSLWGVPMMVGKRFPDTEQ
jgi:hypothetical protein